MAAPIKRYVSVQTINEMVRTFCFFILIGIFHGCTRARRSWMAVVDADHPVVFRHQKFVARSSFRLLTPTAELVLFFLTPSPSIADAKYLSACLMLTNHQKTMKHPIKSSPPKRIIIFV